MLRRREENINAIDMESLMRIDAVVSMLVIFMLLFTPVVGQETSSAGYSGDSSDEYEIPESYVDRARTSGMYLEMSLRDAVMMALENNLQIEIEGYNEELNRELIYGTKGYYDPMFNFALGWNSSERPTTSILDAGQSIPTTISKRWNYNADVSQNIKGGGNLALQFNTSANSTNSAFSYINPSYNSNLSINFTQPLWRGFRHTTSDRQFKLYNLDTKINESQFKMTVADVIDQVQSQYWELVYAIQNHETRRQSLKLALVQLNNNRKKVDIGVLAPIEITSSKAEAATRNQELIASEVSITNAQNNLKGYLASDTDSPIWGKTIIPTQEPEVRELGYTLEEAVNTALMKRPELEQIGYQVAQNEVDREYYRNQGKPDVSFTAGITSQGTSGIVYDVRSGSGGGGLPGAIPTPLPDHPFYGKYGEAWNQVYGFDYLSYNFGINVEIPIMNRSNKAQLAQLAINDRRYQAQLRNTQQSVMVEVKNAFENIITQRESMDAARVARELSEEQLDGETKRFEAGLSTNFEVLQYQRDLATARVNELRAIIDYQLALSALRAATFTIVDDNDVVIAQQGIN